MNAREISLVAMLSVMIFVFTSIRLVVPIPVGVMAVYIFRKFERDAIKALFISNILQAFFLLFTFFNIFIVFTWVASLIDSCVVYVMVIKDSFMFKNRTLFNIGGIGSAPLVLFIIMASWGELTEISAGLPIYTFITALIVAIMALILVMYLSSGVMMLIGFKILKVILDRSALKLEIFDRIIGDSMYERIDEKGGELNVPWSV